MTAASPTMTQFYITTHSSEVSSPPSTKTSQTPASSMSIHTTSSTISSPTSPIMVFFFFYSVIVSINSGVYIQKVTRYYLHINVGFKATTKACCGIGGKYNFQYNIQCGSNGIINGRPVKAVSCSDPASYISWDGIHWTDGANRLLTQHILSGKYFEPSFSLAKFCDLQAL